MSTLPPDPLLDMPFGEFWPEPERQPVNERVAREAQRAHARDEQTI